jgi:hypothetical protein
MARQDERLDLEGVVVAAPSTSPEPATSDDAWYYFAHGTTTSLWGAAAVIQPSGRGDFGAGFYTFADSRWGRAAASEWASRKASAGGRPILVRVKIRRDAFESLLRVTIADDALTSTRQLYWPDELTGYELVVGPVSKRGAEGRSADKRLPPQYKFEGAGIAKLAIDAIIPLHRREVV